MVMSVIKKYKRASYFFSCLELKTPPANRKNPMKNAKQCQTLKVYSSQSAPSVT
jgi:hypothetical protein